MTDVSRTRVSGLYVHVPFCARKCAYCAFYSEASNGELVNRYVEALIRELEMVKPNLQPHTVFFGGGTPSLLNLRQWEKILNAMERLELLGAEEWTVECNPATVSLEKARLLRSFGVNRISMGVQSLDNALLEQLGRIHDREMVFKSFDILRQAGFDNVNIDLMFAIPSQNMSMWRQTLNEAIALGTEHLSCYEVIYEEDTPLYKRLQAGEFAVDEDLACDMYEELVERAAIDGLQQYEIANFARGRREDFLESAGNIPKYACRHNVNYWQGGSFLGIGPSATSYAGGKRTKNYSNTTIYCEQLEKDILPVESSEELAPIARAGETAAFGLRMASGWTFEQFQLMTGYDLRSHWTEEMTQLEQQGWGRTNSLGFRLTREGLRFADAAAQLFLR